MKFVLNFILIFMLILSTTIAFAADAPTAKSSATNNENASATTTNLSLAPESIRVKTYLEDLLVNRFSKDLSTLLNKDSFTLSILVDLLAEIPKKKEIIQTEEPLNDLMLGTIDPEELAKRYAVENVQTATILSNFRIKSVLVNVGLKDDINPNIKTEVEKWLADRLKNEFGPNSKSTVNYIKMPDKKVTTPKDWLDFLSQYQSFAGMALLAATLLIISMLWKLLSSRSSVKFAPAGEFPAIRLDGGKSENAMNTQMKMEQMQQEIEQKEKLKYNEEIDRINTKIREITKKVGPELDAVVKIWCQTGDHGRFKLACFAEAVGKEMGKLAIPPEAVKEVSKVFSTMITMPLQEKIEHLKKSYWDLMTALNVGTESLNQPFGYLGSMSLDSISQLLIDQNPKLKTVISLYLPMDLRIKYLKSLDIQQKKEILDTAISLNEIETAELNTADRTIIGKLKPANSADFVPLEMSFNKIVNALSPLEEVALLSDMDHPGLSNFKKSSPTIAFIHEWPDDKLQMLLSQVPSDELLPYLRLKPEQAERFFYLAPPLTSEVVKDELEKPDNATENEKNKQLDSLNKRVKAMVDNKQVFLEEVFVSFTQDMIDALTKAS